MLSSCLGVVLGPFCCVVLCVAEEERPVAGRLFSLAQWRLLNVCNISSNQLTYYDETYNKRALNSQTVRAKESPTHEPQ